MEAGQVFYHLAGNDKPRDRRHKGVASRHLVAGGAGALGARRTNAVLLAADFHVGNRLDDRLL